MTLGLGERVVFVIISQEFKKKLSLGDSFFVKKQL